MRPHLWIVRVFGRLVPRHLRSEWQREWEAELYYREIRARERAVTSGDRRPRLIRSALSAFWDALWLRAHAMQTLRMLAKHWRLTMVATLSLGAALAVTVAGFGAFNALMLRPPGVESPDRLLMMFVSTPSESFGSLSVPEFTHYRAQNHVFSDVAAIPQMITTATLTTAGVHEMISSSYISDNGFDVLGVRPALGQLAFAPGPGDTGSIIFSHALWARLGSDPSIVGTIVRLDRRPMRVIGVTPAAFTGMVFLFEPDVWLPLRAAASAVGAFDDRTNRWLSLIGRLKPGVTAQQARADIGGLSDELATAYPATDASRRAVLVPPTITPANTRADVLPIGGLLLVVVLTALAAACANVTNLLISLAFIRRQELQIRSALGASRRQLVAQLLRESLILATGAGAIGYGLAALALDWLSHLKVSLGVGFPRMSLDFHPDVTVAWFTIAIVLAVGVSTGLWPAVRAASDAQSSILDRDAASGARRSRARSVLVIVQMTAATVVLIGVGWSARSIANLRHVQPGFTARQLAVADIDLGTNGYKPGDGARFADALRQRLVSMPGVEAVTVADGLPLGETGWGRDQIRLESAAPGTRADETEYSVIDGDFFAALGIQLLEGRTFDARDTDKRPEIVIVNATMARRYWPGGRAVGQRLRIENGNRLVEVIGVAADGKYTDLDEPAMPFFYFARSQHPLTASLDVIVRVAVDAAPWKATLSRVARDIDPALEFRTFTLDDQIKFAMFLPLVTVTAVGGFASLALVLAIVGLYGTVFHSVSQRRHEIGIRMAMGALPRDVFRLVVGRTLWLACAGALAGVGISLALLPLVSELFFGVHAVEPLVVGSVVAVTLAIAAATAYAATRPWSRAAAMELLRSS